MEITMTILYIKAIKTIIFITFIRMIVIVTVDIILLPNIQIQNHLGVWINP